MNVTKNQCFEQKYAEDLERLKRLRLIDDDFMTKVFEDVKCAELLLRIIMDKNDLKVLSVHCQHGLKNLQGRSARLDILATDSENKIYNVEVQRSDKGGAVKRARYNSALIDANVTIPGEAYEKLNKAYVIFITENDVVGDGLPIYHIERIVKETGKPFGDEEHIIYVNSQIQDKTELGRLMHDFYCADAKEMHNKPLADRVRYFKEDEKGVAVMCREMEQMRNETSTKERQEITLRLAKMGMSPEQIAQAVKEPVTVIKNWILNAKD